MALAGTVTLLFTDLVGSTALLERLGEETAERISREHFGVLRRALEEHGGSEVKSLGDGLMAVFPSALSAIQSAVAMQRAVAAGDGAGEPLQLRVGLHAGEPIATGDDFYGRTVVVASRLCDSAAGGEVRASALVRDLVGERETLRFKDLGPLDLHGLSKPIRACSVVFDRPGVPASAPALAAAPASAPAPALEREAARGEVPLPAPLTSSEARRFVGRDGCLDDLRALWQRAQAGDRRVVAVAGEPGIGKTRLAREFGREVHADGAAVLFGRSDEEAIRPYQPFVEALRHAVAHMDSAALARLRASEAAELARLVPELCERRDDLSELPPADADAARFLLFDGIVALVAALARERPVLLVLDDLQWADRPTLLLLRHLARESAGMRVLVLATVRSTEMDALAPTLAELRHDESLEEMAVGGLSSEHVGALIAEQSRGHAPAEFVAAVHHETAGNPFFVGEVVRHATEAGATVTDADALERLGVPRGVKEVIARRVDRLTESARESLTIAAVVGHSFRAEVVEAIAGERGIDALDEAAAIQLVAESPTDIGQFAFTHALVRATLTDDLTPTRRARLHRKIGEALERVYASDPESHLPALAHHFHEGAAGGGDSARAVDYNLRAAARAGALLAYEEVAEHLSRALKRMSGEDEASRRLRCHTLLDLGDAHWNAGELEQARQSYDLAAWIAESMDAPDEVARAAIGFAGRGAEDWGEAPPRKIDLLERALAGLPADRDALRARLLSNLARGLVFGEHPERVEQLSRDAVDLARKSGDPVAIGDALLARHWALWNPAHIRERSQLGDELIEVAEQAGDADLLLNGWGAKVVVHSELGELEELEHTIDEYARIAHELRKPYFVMAAHAARATLHTLAGRLDEAEAALGDAYGGDQTKVYGRLALQMCSAQAATLRFERGDMESLKQPLETAAEQFPAVPGWRAMLARVLAGTGHPDEAAQLLAQLGRDDFGGIPFEGNWMCSIATCAMVCTMLNDREHAGVLYRRLAPYAGQHVVVGSMIVWLGPVDRYLGMLALTMEDWDDAVDCLEHAIAMSERMKAAPWIARSQAGAAVARVRRDGPGDAERARELLASADAVVESLGLEPLRIQVDLARAAIGA